jgi:hypothetical protein
VAQRPQTDFTPDRAERLALAELELARVEAACVYDGCEADCGVRDSLSRSVESERAHLQRLAPSQRLEGAAA